MPELDHAAIANVLSRLDAQSVAKCATVNSTWRSCAMDENLWKRLCAVDLDEDQPYDHLLIINGPAVPCGTWRATYATYMNKFQYLHLGLPDCRVAIRFWQAVRKWASQHFPYLLETINPGASVEELQRVLDKCKYDIPDVLVAMYAIADGQSILSQRAAAACRSQQHGLNHFAGLFGHERPQLATGVMPNFARAASGVFRKLDDALSCGVQQGTHGLVRFDTPTQASPELIAFEACSHSGLFKVHGPDTGLRHGFFTLSRSNLLPKSIVVDVQTIDRAGGPKVMRHNPHDVARGYANTTLFFRNVVDVVPGKRAALRSHGDTGAPDLCAWLEGFAARLLSGGACRASVQDKGVLELVPSLQGASECVTRGIRVRARAWATANVDHEQRTMFAYSVEFSHVVEEGEEVPAGMVPCAQLFARHWDFFAPGDATPCNTVEGPGVVGEFPVIKPGKSYDYQSYCPGHAGGALEGYFLFNSIDPVTGDSREVKAVCPRMDFVIPDLIY